MYKRHGNNEQAIATLKPGAKANPSDSSIPYSLGLAYIRAKETSQAQHHLKLAAQLAKTSARYYYVYALALVSNKPKKAEENMQKSL
ncbi:MAG: hypothetical protein GY787_10720 [Alteromonadales bacterium]|nr:hypothetical protein [Alteromonadales bacterium]